MWWKRRTYLDAAAGIRGNPSSPHEEGRRAKKALEDARTDIARLLEVQSDDVIFTSGATESNALAILGHLRALRLQERPDAPGRNNMHILYLPSAHASVAENMKLLAAEGVSVEALPVKDARVDVDALAKLMRKETVLVSMDAVCGETGVVWNTREVAEILRKSGTRVLLHVDASQAPFTEKMTSAHFDADLLTLDGAKVGPRGVGILVAHRTIPLAPLYGGGGQERGLRSGSEAPELARAFAAALTAAAQGREKFRAAAARERARLAESIAKAVPNIQMNEGRARHTGSVAGRAQAPNILNISLPGRDTDYLVALLDEAGFAVSTRSACETDSEEGSRAVFSLFGDRERARATLRISWGPGIRHRELDRFAEALMRSIAFIDSSASR